MRAHARFMARGWGSRIVAVPVALPPAQLIAATAEPTPTLMGPTPRSRSW